MTTPTGQATSPESWHSARSNASSYHSVEMTPSGAGVQTSPAPVPDDAPSLPDSNHTGIYVQDTEDFYAVHEDKGLVSRFSRSAREWGNYVAANKGRIAKAVIDAAPSLIQGSEPLVQNERGKTIVKAVGIAAQTALGTGGLLNEARHFVQGRNVDYVNVTTDLVRLAAGTMNTVGAAANQEDPRVKITDGAGTYAGGLATGVSTYHHQQQPVRTRRRKVEDAESLPAADDVTSLASHVSAMSVSGTQPTQRATYTKLPTADDALGRYDDHTRAYAKWFSTNPVQHDPNSDENTRKVANWYKAAKALESGPTLDTRAMMSGANNSQGYTNTGYAGSNHASSSTPAAGLSERAQGKRPVGRGSGGPK